MRKRAKGQYYTTGSPFLLKPFKKWADESRLADSPVLEPFAGANSLITQLRENNLCNEFRSYDLFPNHSEVKKRDTIKSFPQGFKACVTNPPWLARNSATRRRLPFPDTKYDDLYKHCLELCLNNCDHVCALLPASFLQSGLFRERLSSLVFLHEEMFVDTENPVCLAMFKKQASEDVRIYFDDKFIGKLSALEKKLPEARRRRKVIFNAPHGKLGFIAFDSVKEPSIRFCSAEKIKDYEIKGSSRFVTRIYIDSNVSMNKLVPSLNEEIESFRKQTRDIFLTPFKGKRKDGYYRRRMSFALARRFINAA